MTFVKPYRHNGVVYAATRRLLMEKGQMIGKDAYGIVIPEGRPLDIDTFMDFLIVEAYIKCNGGV